MQDENEMYRNVLANRPASTPEHELPPGAWVYTGFERVNGYPVTALLLRNAVAGYRYVWIRPGSVSAVERQGNRMRVLFDQIEDLEFLLNPERQEDWLRYSWEIADKLLKKQEKGVTVQKQKELITREPVWKGVAGYWIPKPRFLPDPPVKEGMVVQAWKVEVDTPDGLLQMYCSRGALPEVGDEVELLINNIGKSIVVGYMYEGRDHGSLGWVGILVQPHKPPNPLKGVCGVYPPEYK